MLGKLVSSLALAGAASATFVNLQTSSALGKSILQSTNFDYIIVGGGVAGLTLGRRLSENSSKKVLVLEAGRSGINDTIVTIPANSFSFIATDIDWFDFSVPQVHANNLTINTSSGKILGGGSAVNGLVWIRGPKAEYDAIEQLGSPGWNWNSLYTTMKKSEKLNQPDPVYAQEFGYSAVASSHGSSGPIDVSFPPFIPEQHQRLINASVELGHVFNQDPYSGNNTGVFFSLSSQTKQAVRESAEFAYIDPVISRSNLVVFAYALVTKLDLTSAAYGKVRSTGVKIRFPDGSVKSATAKASGEVVLTAGALRTPQLLELSGIGDPAVLTPLGIPVKLALPSVGTNYEDHTITVLTYQLKAGYLSFDALDYNATLKAEQQELYKQGKGWLTFANAVLNMSPIEKILTPAEIEEAHTILATKPPTIGQDSFNIIKNQIFSGVPQIEFLLFNSFSGGETKLPNTSYVSAAITHLHPLSRGSIHIKSASIDDKPLINPNVLESEWDHWLLSKATKYARKFFQTQAFREIFEQEEVWPGSAVETDAQFQDWVKANINTGYHSVGTASLLPLAKGGVVDKNLRVYGATNLRIADMSVMPLLISAHTQTAAYGIAEKAADIIKST
ncbi:hypothetical protein BDQ12DRAFT_685079 [Crucibulum laeve]|uniref:pyranose dehydrogenase (acceptor) n=1 Tax=Crucibulum laeve TaxID=68775 RepID=A0A5C3LWR1_9AGAR|nr:hypothetical protein BDQ12DRAFT_685079 [Crucibulum laeve]